MEQQQSEKPILAKPEAGSVLVVSRLESSVRELGPQRAQYITEFVWEELDLEGACLEAAHHPSFESTYITLYANDDTVFPLKVKTKDGSIPEDIASEEPLDLWCLPELVGLPNAVIMTLRPMDDGRLVIERRIGDNSMGDNSMDVNAEGLVLRGPAMCAKSFRPSSSRPCQELSGSVGLQYIFHLMRQMAPEVRTLNIVESLTRYTLADLDVERDRDIFARLENISLCVTYHFLRKHSGPTIELLRTAKNLRNLKLCFRSALKTEPMAICDVNRFLASLFCRPCWPKLRTIRIINTSKSREVQERCPKDWWAQDEDEQMEQEQIYPFPDPSDPYLMNPEYSLVSAAAVEGMIYEADSEVFGMRGRVDPVFRIPQGFKFTRQHIGQKSIEFLSLDENAYCDHCSCLEGQEGMKHFCEGPSYPITPHEIAVEKIVAKKSGLPRPKKSGRQSNAINAPNVANEAGLPRSKRSGRQWNAINAPKDPDETEAGPSDVAKKVVAPAKKSRRAAAPRRRSMAVAPSVAPIAEETNTGSETEPIPVSDTAVPEVKRRHRGKGKAIATPVLKQEPPSDDVEMPDAEEAPME